ncbi:MAG: HlyD family type I secretion periplasmic adaptor subunit [Oleiphilus sp.]|nr:MAG: HlyD family type I secretion periplasmic adaptor subunit [Oleiphilus sp.]
MIIWLIVSLFVIAVIWAVLGKIDIVAVAQGKVIPSEHVKQIQSLESARVTGINVREGQSVQQGEVLIELDKRLVHADYKRLEGEWQSAHDNLQRLGLLNDWLSLKGSESKTLTPFQAEPLAPPNLTPAQSLLLDQEQAEIREQLLNFDTEAAKLEAEASMIQAEIVKKEQVIPVLKERVDALDTLQKKSYGSKLQFLELKQELIEEQQDLAVQQARLGQLEVSQTSIAHQRKLYLAEKRKQTQVQLNETSLQVQSLKQETSKAKDRLDHFTLTAPISGQVQQLEVHTIGGVVTPAQPLMTIVPNQSQLEVEVMLQNKDIGFVEEGQKVEVKVDTFNFTKYGFIDGTLASISDDAIQDENLGLVYSARVQLEQDGLTVNGKYVRLSPGMSVTAEVKTGTRRLIEFFLSPLLRYQQESLGER